MFSYFKNLKTNYFDVFCLNFSIETKIKTLFLISYFNLSKKRNGTLSTRILYHNQSTGFPILAIWKSWHRHLDIGIGIGIGIGIPK